MSRFVLPSTAPLRALSQTALPLLLVILCPTPRGAWAQGAAKEFETLLTQLETELRGDQRASLAEARRTFHVASSTLPGLEVATIVEHYANASPAARQELALLLIGFPIDRALPFLVARLRAPEVTEDEAFALATACAYALQIPSDIPSRLDLRDRDYRAEIADTYERLGEAVRHRSVARARTSEWIRKARRLLAQGDSPAASRALLHSLETGALALLGNFDPTFTGDLVELNERLATRELRGVLLHALSYATGIAWLERAREGSPEDPVAAAFEALAGWWEAHRHLDADALRERRWNLHGLPPENLPRELRLEGLVRLLDHESPLVRFSALEALTPTLALHPDPSLYFFPLNRRHHSLASLPQAELWDALKETLRARIL